MTHSAETVIETQPLQPDYRQALPEYYKRKYPEVIISDAAYQIAGDLLNFEQAAYGDPDSPHYLRYHNQLHSEDVGKRGLWIIDFANKQLGRSRTDLDYELTLIAASGHDPIQAAFRKDKDILVCDFGDYTVTLENDPEKSDEQLSADLTVAMMKHYKHHEKTERKRVRAAIAATEYMRINRAIELKDIARKTRDPVVIATVIADTSSIFLGGEAAMVRDVSDYAAELVGDDIDDPGKVTEMITSLMAFQKKFLLARAAEYNLLLHHLGGNDSDPASHIDELLGFLDPYYRHTIQFADFAERNATAFGRVFSEKLAAITDTTLRPHEKIGFAATKAYAALTSVTA